VTVSKEMFLHSWRALVKAGRWILIILQLKFTQYTLMEESVLVSQRRSGLCSRIQVYISPRGVITVHTPPPCTPYLYGSPYGNGNKNTNKNVVNL
jgi:hypothetical protein